MADYIYIFTTANFLCSRDLLIYLLVNLCHLVSSHDFLFSMEQFYLHGYLLLQYFIGILSLKMVISVITK